MKNSHIIYTFLFLWLSACTSQSPVVEKSGPFCLTDTLAKNIVLDTAMVSTVKNQLRLTGKVSFDEEKVAKVYPLVSGTVTIVKSELGDYVHKGQVLAIVKSSEIADYEQQMISAQSNLLIAQKNADVAGDMFKSGLISEKEYLTAQREGQKAEAELHKVKEIFKIYGVGQQSDYVLRAPISGFVVEKNITSDMQLRSDNNSPAFTISALEEVWIMANVYETDIAKIQLGYEADISTVSYPDKIFRGKVDKIFNVLDPDTRVMKVRIRLGNNTYMLKPGMYANILLQYDDKEQMPAIDKQAVIFDKNKNFVMVYKDRCKLETREVNLYKTTGNTSYIKSGLQAGEQVVSKYQLLIYDALND